MIDIEIRKYVTRNGGLKNYFDRPVFVDRIAIDHVLEESFPVFNEVYENDTNTFELRSSDFDLIIHFLQDNVSGTNTTVRDFFENNIDNHILVVKVKLNGKLFGGIIDIQSIDLDYTTTDNGWKVSFSTYGFVQEFSEWASGKPKSWNNISPQSPVYFSYFLQGIGGGIPSFFNSQINSNLQSYVKFDFTALNWNTKIGYEPVLVWELWKLMVDGTTNSDGVTNDVSTWKLFADLCKGLGIVYKFNITDEIIDNYYFTIKFKLAFRNTLFQVSRTSSALDFNNKHKGYKLDEQINKTIFLKLAVARDFPDRSYGLVFNDTDSIVVDGNFLQYNEQVVFIDSSGFLVQAYGSPNPFPTTIPEVETSVQDFNYYFDCRFWEYTLYGLILVDNIFGQGVDAEYYGSEQGQFKPKNIAFPRLWTRAGYYFPIVPSVNLRMIQCPPDGSLGTLTNIMNNTALKSYKCLTPKFSRTVKANISLIDNNENIELFDTRIIDGVNYGLYKLSNLNINERKVDTEWIETISE